MTRGEQCFMLLGMWVGLFPTITAIIYLDMRLEPSWPIWSGTFVATAVAVPFTNLGVMPSIKWLIARFHGMSVQEYDIACCNPEGRGRNK